MRLPKLPGFSLMVILLGLAASAQTIPGKAGIRISSLQCDNRQNPASVDPDRVTFSWQMESEERNQFQTAYQILLAGSREKLDAGEGDLWKSGKVKSRQNLRVPCPSRLLEAGREYFWKVKVWDKNGVASEWSQAGQWVTALRSAADWRGARWIGYQQLPVQSRLVPGVHGLENHAQSAQLERPVVPWFRKTVEVKKPIQKALIFISGLGHYELYGNGVKVGESFLSPGWTDYEKTCLYNSYDLTDQLRAGANVLGVIVGNGFHHIAPERYWKLSVAYGLPKMICLLRIRYTDGSEDIIASGPDWKTIPSPVTFSSIFGGEDYDARLEPTGWSSAGFDDSHWQAALLVDPPEGALKPETIFPLKIHDTFSAVKISQPLPGIYLYDFGQNCSGIVRLTVQGNRGQSLKLIPAELVNRQSLANQKASGEPYFWTYTLRGGQPEVWSPRFTYYGFRYVQVEGAVPAGEFGNQEAPKILDLQLLHTRNSAPSRGQFECSSDLFNRIYQLIDWAIRSNFASVLTDCPHREKLGWLEQTYLMGEAVHFQYDLYHLYRKQIRDMMDSQLVTGLVPDIAPEYVEFREGFRDSPEWGSASVILPMLLYRWYGDLEPAQEAYPMMKKYVAYLGTKADQHILSHGLGDWYDLGPRFPGEAQLTPKAVTATALYYLDVKLMEEYSQLLGFAGESAAYRQLSSKIRKAFKKAFFDEKTGIYAAGSQTAMAMPLCVGLVEEKDRKRVFDNLVRTVEKDGKALTAGDIGFHFLVKALADGGAGDLLHAMNSREDVPGYGFQLKKQATALTESWAALEEVSNNHLMLGHLMEWFFTGLAGINQAGDSTAYQKILLRPQLIEPLEWVQSRFDSPYGEVVSSWKKDGAVWELEVKIPVNTKAEIHLPVQSGRTVFLDGRLLRESGGLSLQKQSGGVWRLKAGSGRYRFEIRPLQ